MGLLQETAYQYYESKQTFVATQGQTDFTLTLSPLPESTERFNVTLNDVEITSGLTYDADTGVITIAATNLNDVVTVILKDTGLGKYRFTSLLDIVNNYMIGYVGDGKIMNSVKRSDVLFHAKRGIQEFAYDVTRVEKIQEIEVGPSLSIPMPQDYVNYVKISFVDDAGIERLIMPTRLSSKATEPILQDEDYKYLYDQNDELLLGSSVIEDRFKNFDITKISGSANDTEVNYNADNSLDRLMVYGGRYGLNPETTTENGVFIIDEANGKISFSSNIADKIITLRYISDGLGTDDEMKVHKFAEEAMYKHISYGIANAKANMPEYIVNRFRKERRAAIRNAKIRLANLKMEELTQVMKGKAKIIK